MNNGFIYEEQKQLIEMWKNKYYEQKEELKQLQNNRDKAIEYLEEKYEHPISYYCCIKETLKILKGDSDE